MFKLVATLAIIFYVGIGDGATKLQSCKRSTDCSDGEMCLSYTCNNQQVKKCIPRECYYKNKNCPGGIVCHKKSCSDINCAIKNN